MGIEATPAQESLAKEGKFCATTEQRDAAERLGREMLRLYPRGYQFFIGGGARVVFLPAGKKVENADADMAVR